MTRFIILLAASLLAACATPEIQVQNVESCELTVSQARDQGAVYGFSEMQVSGRRRDNLVASWNEQEPKTEDNPAEVWVFAHRDGVQGVFLFGDPQGCVFVLMPVQLRHINEVMDGGRPL